MDKLIEGYHETNIENIASIMANGFVESISQYRKHWLGRGVYLYEDLYYAVEWTILNDKNKVEIDTYDKACENCGIISVKIDSEEYNVLDVSSPLGYSIFLKLKEIIKINYPPLIYEKICSGGDANIIKTLEKLEEKQGKKYLSYYDVVCAIYPKYIYKKKRKRHSDFYVGIQKQICIKNLSAIKEYKCIELKENKEIEDMFNLIIENRRNIKDDK